MLFYATDICNKKALKNQRRGFVSNILISAQPGQVLALGGTLWIAKRSLRLARR